MQIQEFIKQLGLDSFSHETFDKEDNEVKGKKKKNKKLEAAAEIGELANDSTSKPDRTEKPKGKTAKVNDKKTVSEKPTKQGKSKKSLDHGHASKNVNKGEIISSVPSKKTKQLKPLSSEETFATKSKQGSVPNSKRITFDDTGTAVAAPAPAKGSANASINLEAKQNKKIVFDESYLVNSETGNSGKSEGKGEWYNLLIMPDVPWYDQRVQLKPSTQYVTGPELKKLEDEAREHLEADSQNFKKGTFETKNESDSMQMFINII